MQKQCNQLIAICLALVVTLPTFAAQPPRRADHPKLRAALHELREARNELTKSRDIWPPGYRDRATRSIEDAMRTLQTMLAVQNANPYRGLDRNPDYYQRYQDHPRLRAALDDLRDARDELRNARDDFGNLKERAIDDLDVAIGDIIILIRHNRR
jgi:hypothetical protein